MITSCFGRGHPSEPTTELLAARSTTEFRARPGIVDEECDETMYGIEPIADSGLVPEHLLCGLTREANEILAITVQSINTSKRSS